MERLVLQNLHSWRNKKNRLPLILKGARQVGETWLLKEFGRTGFKDYLYINFENNPSMSDLFVGSIDPHRILELVGALHGKK